MWVQALVTHSRMTHSKKAKNRVNHSRVKETRVEMTEMETKKKIWSKPSQTPISQISPSHTQQNDPLEESKEHSEGDQGGDDGDEDEEEYSLKTVSDPNRLDKHKSPEAEEVTKPRSIKKAKASKGTNIVEESVVTIEELDQALTKSTEALTNKWS